LPLRAKISISVKTKTCQNHLCTTIRLRQCPSGDILAALGMQLQMFIQDETDHVMQMNFLLKYCRNFSSGDSDAYFSITCSCSVMTSPSSSNAALRVCKRITCRIRVASPSVHTCNTFRE
jgi:hypothetical protein